ncbi:hypothetical protein CDCA_CDCA05G1534 [Cyanidium caldarium]|uniref:t-SNARE coiled-coil homology domain-containing protein n=1 Tax=Cyanidium caldarium TaxID=2771 RepID=A0AAV9ITE0_CYACA|nr:hypothetical protein CDCA_CDCA05G1534 [Cyanidium caldarium]
MRELAQNIEQVSRENNHVRRLCARLEADFDALHPQVVAAQESCAARLHTAEGQLRELTTRWGQHAEHSDKLGDTLRLRKLRRDLEQVAREHRNVRELVAEVESEAAECRGQQHPQPQQPASAESTWTPAAEASRSPLPPGAPSSAPLPAMAALRGNGTATDVPRPLHAYGTFGADVSGKQMMAVAGDTTTAAAAEQSLQHRQALLDAVYAEEDQRERHTILQRLQTGMHEVQSIFKSLSLMVSDQQASLEEVEAGTAGTASEQQRAADELEVAARRRRRRRRCCTWLAVWVTLIALVGLYILLH